MNINDTAIIFGCGSSINENSNYINYLLNNYTTVGINRFPSEYSKKFLSSTKSANVTYWIYSDDGLAQDNIINNYQNQKIIICNNAHNDLKLLEKNGIPIYYKYSITPQPVLKENGLLGGKGTTALHAINFLMLKGFKNIILLGVDNKLNNQNKWEYFYNRQNYPEKTHGADNANKFTNY